MRRVAEKIGIDERRGYDAGAIFGEARGAERPRGEVDKVLSGVARRQCVHVLRLWEICQGMINRSASVINPNSVSPRMVRRKMPAKARSGLMLPVMIWM